MPPPPGAYSPAEVLSVSEPTREKLETLAVFLVNVTLILLAGRG